MILANPVMCKQPVCFHNTKHAHVNVMLKRAAVTLANKWAGVFAFHAMHTTCH